MKILNSRSSIDLALENLNFLINHPQYPANRLKLNTAKKIKGNYLFSSRTKKELATYLQDLLSDLVKDRDEKQFPFHQIALERLLHFNPNLFSDLGIEIPAVFARKKITANKHVLLAETNEFHQYQDKLVSIQYDSKTGLYTSPDDEMAHQHGKEATRIFFSTQSERIKGFLNWLFAKIGIHIFESASYEEHDYLHSEIYASDMAVDPYNADTCSHFWVGHATNLIKINSLTILTDPVEGHLNALMYPRMTEEANKIKDAKKTMLPKIDLVVISHNHRDHVDIDSLKKLVEQQPLMIIPEGDWSLFQGLGFTNIVELKWWEQVSIHQDGKEILRTTAVPTKHWSGRGLCDAHRSAFNGYVFQSPKLNGDIYFAGDTALMKDETFSPMLEHFNIKVSIQPGGPDEVREDMQSTHQSSADALLMHFQILRSEYEKMPIKDMVNFLAKAQEIKTIYNHTATFKLGNLRLRDTFYSLNRIITAFQEDENWRKANLRGYELEVFNKICDLNNQMIFSGEKTLSFEQIIVILQTSIVVPKIGQRQDLMVSELRPEATTINYRNLILNKRALIEFDVQTQSFIEEKHQGLNFTQLITKLFDGYEKPWYSRFSRHHLNSIESLEHCKTPETLLIAIQKMEQNMQPLNTHGHMQNLIHYAKWLITNFANQENPLENLQEFFICQRIKRKVDAEIKRGEWFFWFSESRKQNQVAFKALADQLEKCSNDLETYREKFRLCTVELPEDRAYRFWSDSKTHSQRTIDTSTLQFK